jgi:hypothetical protein
MLAGATPFVIDMQDGLFINSFGAPLDPLGEPRYSQSMTLLRQRVARRPWRAAERRQAVATLRSLEGLSAAQVDWICEDAWRAVIEASLPKGVWEMAQPADDRERLRAAMHSHLVRLTQDWADQVATVVEQVTG